MPEMLSKNAKSEFDQKKWLYPAQSGPKALSFIKSGLFVPKVLGFKKFKENEQ